MPRRAPALDDDARRTLGGAFASGGARYDAVRPAYPEQAVNFMIPPGARDGVDLGAGTGILTAQAAARGLTLTAVDTSADMLARLAEKLPGVRIVEARAEATGLPSASTDVVLCAQAWHWLEPDAATREALRLLRPGGTLALVWNQLDVTVPWVHRLSRIMHAGDVHRPDFVPVTGPGLAGLESLQTRWEAPATPEGLIDLARSRSYYLRASEAVRAKVEANLEWYLHEHLGHAPGQPLLLPYYTHAWRGRAA
ncbi:class I SAM-dependent methyltransferase [Zafaria sp. Z1313]|uniref:class I SAM-dependent methyltransferase n=1 Tax=unclassified Zafaria TaxID=2828765 RepID=UPI003D303B8D